MSGNELEAKAFRDGSDKQHRLKYTLKHKARNTFSVLEPSMEMDHTPVHSCTCVVNVACKIWVKRSDSLAIDISELHEQLRIALSISRLKHQPFEDCPGMTCHYIDRKKLIT